MLGTECRHPVISQFLPIPDRVELVGFETVDKQARRLTIMSFEPDPNSDNAVSKHSGYQMNMYMIACSGRRWFSGETRQQNWLQS
jgi:hypothetical protein